MEILFKIDDLDQVVNTFFEAVGSARVFAFHGEMGMGKTTFISAVCSRLGVKSSLSSPTFSIINEYRSSDSNIIYHIDLYRLKDEREAIAAGIEECIHSGNYCFIEWPERTPELFPENTVHCFLSIIGPDERKLKIIL